MDVVIFHYHLNPGGVTRIIESQIPSIKIVSPETKVKIVCGHCADVEKYVALGAEVIVKEQLNYLPDDLSDDELQEKYQFIVNIFKNNASRKDILHLHNLNLGKNPLVTYAAYKLATEGYHVVNHCHDFAEDRPANWAFLKSIIEDTFHEQLQQVLYPQLPNYLFATLTIHDLNKLNEYDLNCNRKYLLPNPVNLGTEKKEVSKHDSSREIRKNLHLGNEKKIFTYPVRVIQRKNIGEFIFLATLFADIAYWLVTQPPKNPKEVVKYNDWKAFCKAHDVEIFFEVGMTMNFDTLITGSDACITTSKKEGFGMVYLEPWLSFTPVIGRELDHIVFEFKHRGVKFPSLYTKLYVNFEGEITDFKDLSLEQQKKIILMGKNKNYKEEILSLNMNLNTIFDVIPDEIISHNRNIIIKQYSLEKFGERLYGIYKRFSD